MRYLVIALILVGGVVGITAQGAPMPDDFAVITAENAHRLTRLATLDVHTLDLDYPRVDRALIRPGTSVVYLRAADGSNWQWDALTDAAPQRLAFASTRVAGSAFSPDGARLAYVTQPMSGGAALMLWAPDTDTAVELTRHAVIPRFLAFDADGARLALAGRSVAPVEVWDVSAGERLLTLPPETTFADFALFLPGDRLVTEGLTASGEQAVTVWSLKTGEQLWALPTTQIVVHPTAPMLLARDWSSGETGWELIDLDRPSVRIKRAFDGQVLGIGQAGDVVFSASNGALWVAHFHTGARLADLQPWSWSLDLSDDGRFVAVAGQQQVALFGVSE